MNEKLTLSVDELAQELGISKSYSFGIAAFVMLRCKQSSPL